MVWEKATVKKTLKILCLIFNSILDYTVSFFSCYIMHELIESEASARQKKQSIKWKATMEWEKIFANPTFDKGLIYKIYKEPI